MRPVQAGIALALFISILSTGLLPAGQVAAKPLLEINPVAAWQVGIEVEGEQAYVYLTNGPEKRRIVSEPARALGGPFASNVILSPDAGQLLYVSLSDSQQPEATIWRVNTDGSGRQSLALYPQQRLWTAPFAWSPDSRRIAYVLQTPGGQLELWKMDADGSNKERLLEQNAFFRPEIFQGDNRAALKWSSTGNLLEITDRAASPHKKHLLDLATFQVTSIEIPPAAPAGPRRINLPLFTQTDPRWGNDYLGCGTTIGSQGCALTSTAMVFKYYGVDTNPKQLKNCLGYSACPMNWGGAGRGCGAGKVSGGAIQSFDYSIAQAALAKGFPVIVGFQVYGWRTHFVVITGGSGQDAAGYSVVDPWDATSSKTLHHFMSTLGWPDQMNIFEGTPPDAYTPGQGSSRQPAMVEAINRNGGPAAFGSPVNAAHWWYGVVIQDFAGDPAALIHDEVRETEQGLVPGACRSYAVRRGLFNWYTANGSPVQFGAPTSDEYVFDGVAQQSFSQGYIRLSHRPAFTPWPAGGEGWRAEYFNNPQLACAPAWVSYLSDASLNFNWHSARPHPALNQATWSARFSREVNLTGGAYRLTVGSDQEVKVWLDSRLIVDRQAGQTGGPVEWNEVIEAGPHRLQVEYRGGAGTLKLDLALTGDATGPAAN